MNMNELIKRAEGFEANDKIMYWINTTLANYLEKKELELSQAEHILDYFLSEDSPEKIEGMSVEQALEQAEKWINKENQEGEKIIESEKDTELILDFKDGYKIVKLVGENAYKREGFLMHHCVASYFGRDINIYSLRDYKNNPHCTIEEDNQIKGYGNGEISKKYVKYIVEFLESTGMEMRDEEMNNLGYRTCNFGKYIKNKLYRDKYLPKTEKIIPKEGVLIFTDLEKACNYEDNL